MLAPPSNISTSANGYAKTQGRLLSSLVRQEGTDTYPDSGDQTGRALSCAAFRDMPPFN